MKKGITILGSTGSIGKQTLEVVSALPHRFNVVGLAAKGNLDLLASQIAKFSPKIVSVENEEAAEALQRKLGKTRTIVYSGFEGLTKLATLKETGTVVVAIPGSTAIIPTLEAIKAKKDIALASKEVLVAAGHLIMNEVHKRKVKLMPIDSEHSAVYQCLKNEKAEKIKKIILTASGGPFLNSPVEKLAKVTVKEALSHPKWKMGNKISIDSATLMNKGFEVIEAHHLFGIDYNKIDVVVHPQSIIHSLIEFIDGTMLAQLAAPDMRLAIQYALLEGERIENNWGALNLIESNSLTFEPPNKQKFPCLDYAYRAGKTGGTMPAVLNAANDEATRLFLEEQISFADIPKIIKNSMDKHKIIPEPTIEDILHINRTIKKEVKASTS
ncbi:1-deoxy-D-xylulose-5-phosphate reductoisomerase [Candidatus Margulisiibacteriota bacterium]